MARKGVDELCRWCGTTRICLRAWSYQLNTTGMVSSGSLFWLLRHVRPNKHGGLIGIRGRTILDMSLDCANILIGVGVFSALL